MTSLSTSKVPPGTIVGLSILGLFVILGFGYGVFRYLRQYEEIAVEQQVVDTMARDLEWLTRNDVKAPRRSWYGRWGRADEAREQGPV